MIKYLILTLLFLTLDSCQENSPESEINSNSIVELSLKEKAKRISIKVLDTDFSKGRLTHEQEISLWDIQKMHGHLCDGLIVGFLGLQQALYQLYPDSLIDRTNTRIVAKSSPCIGDVGLYLTGGRYQFNTFYVDNTIEGLYIVQRLDNGSALLVQLKNGIKPAKIDELGAKAVRNELDACQLDSLKKMEDDFSRLLLTNPPQKYFETIVLNKFQWNPVLKNDFVKTDILNKKSTICK
ncbi:MAG: formylmethanofuran dehydrogenase subunit E family protein [Crocinitomicaceae bacterium]